MTHPTDTDVAGRAKKSTNSLGRVAVIDSEPPSSFRLQANLAGMALAFAHGVVFRKRDTVFSAVVSIPVVFGPDKRPVRFVLKIPHSGSFTVGGLSFRLAHIDRPAKVIRPQNLARKLFSKLMHGRRLISYASAKGHEVISPLRNHPESLHIHPSVVMWMRGHASVFLASLFQGSPLKETKVMCVA